MVTKETCLESSFGQLEDGVYEIREGMRQLDICSVRESGMLLRDFINSTDKGNYILEKIGSDAILLIKPENRPSKSSFFAYKDRYQFIIDYFQKCTGTSNIVLGFDRDGRIAGIFAFFESKLHFRDFAAHSVIREFMSVEDFEKRYAADYSETAPVQEPQQQSEANQPDEYMKAVLGILTPKKMLAYFEQRIQGQGVQLKIAVYYIYRYIQNVAQGGKFHAENWILTAPSGSGKTEFYRTVKSLFELYEIPIPVVQIDLSQITETGFKGDNVSTIPKKILLSKPDSKGIAICFLDEADKKCIPSYSNNVNVNAAAQANMLTMLEGSEWKIEIDDEQKDFDTSYTMFVLMGAFQGIRQQKSAKHSGSKPLGFTAQYDETYFEDDTDKVSDSFYEDITLQDMIDFGMMEELAGRMVQVVNFHRLSKEAMRSLIKYKVGEISNSMKVDIEIAEEAAEEFLDISFGSLGVRRPMNIIKELAQNTVAEVFFDEKFDSRKDKVVIDSLESAHIERRFHWSEYQR